MGQILVAHMHGALWALGIILLLSPGGGEAQRLEKLSSQEMEAVTKQLAEAKEHLKPFLPDHLWHAHGLLQSVLGKSSVETSHPKLATKAHRLRAGVYYGASMIVGPPAPGLTEEQRKIHEAVKRLGQDGWEKAAAQIKASLRLDPTQPDRAELSEAATVLGGKSDLPLDQFGRFMRLLMQPL